ncbi:MAG: hypothetical protein K2N71_05180 [Oscillospiraceae bacterium]|nr:hypothetical protein [Oscillospiraceae bacterium]
MTSKKFLLGAILAAAVCLTACSKGGSENVSETKNINKNSVERIKEALQAEWDKSEHDIFFANLYTADLNGDGVKELFANYTFETGYMGITYVYDVSDGVKKLYELSARMWSGKNELYKDESGILHLIFAESYTGGIGGNDDAYFDITYDNAKMPLYAKECYWYEDGEHHFVFDLYKDCECAQLDFINDFSGWRNFDPQKAEYIDRFDAFYYWDAVGWDAKNDISELIQKEVYEGMTYVSEIEEIYQSTIYSKNNNKALSINGFWQEADPKLAEVYAE